MVAKTKVTVLGCGKIGKLVTFLLATSGDYDVLAVDVSLEIARNVLQTLDEKSKSSVNCAAANFSDENSLVQVLTGREYVVSCAPYHCNTLIARVAKSLGVSYLDLTEDVQTTKTVRELAQGSELFFAPQCGLAPGFITIVANHLSLGFDKIDSVKMRVGALPVYPHNRLKYNLTWSTEGLINEYGNPCEAIIDGKHAWVQPLEGHETFSLDGQEYEAFNTSGGLGTLCETWEGKVNSLDYKSVRYPGHRDIIALLMNDLKLNQDRGTLSRIFENALPHTYQDVVLVFVTVCGWKNGRYSQRSHAKKIYNSEIGGHHWGAIQTTTAGGICAVLDLMVQGAIKNRGFVKQEDIDFQAFIQNRFGKVYQ